LFLVRKLLTPIYGIKKAFMCDMLQYPMQHQRPVEAVINCRLTVLAVQLFCTSRLLHQFAVFEAV